MLQLDSQPVIYGVFVVAAATELFFFMMQRSALEIGRAAEFSDRDSRRMLPLWYLSVWPAKMAKWGAAISIGLMHNWSAALVLLVFAFIFSIIVPIPHRQFMPVFRRKLAKEIGASIQVGNSEANTYARLYRILFEANHDPQL